MVFSLALRMTGDRGLAEEIAQDVFLDLDRNLAKIESRRSTRFWLRRVAMSRSTDALRRRRVRGMDLRLRWTRTTRHRLKSGPLR